MHLVLFIIGLLSSVAFNLLVNNVKQLAAFIPIMFNCNLSNIQNDAVIIDFKYPAADGRSGLRLINKWVTWVNRLKRLYSILALEWVGCVRVGSEPGSESPIIFLVNSLKLTTSSLVTACM